MSMSHVVQDAINQQINAELAFSVTHRAFCKPHRPRVQERASPSNSC